jgi:hypothetical protein
VRKWSSSDRQRTQRYLLQTARVLPAAVHEPIFSDRTPSAPPVTSRELVPCCHLIEVLRHDQVGCEAVCTILQCSAFQVIGRKGEGGVIKAWPRGTPIEQRDADCPIPGKRFSEEC